MLEISILRERMQEAKEGLRKRGLNEEFLQILHRILDLDDKRKSLQTTMDERKAEVNQISKTIGSLYREGKASEAEELKGRVTGSKEKIRDLENEFKVTRDEIYQLLLQVPNIPNESVPAGTSEEDNEIYRPWPDALPDPGPGSLPHWELGTKYNILDFELGVKLTGAGFPVFRGMGARLERALIHFFLDQGREAGYEEIAPPLMVNADTARATGQLPDKEGQMYHVVKDELYLIPTAEVPVTNIYRDSILEEKDLPIKMTAYTPCFRREAGSYGADVKGLNRVHQFDKVEIVQLEHPDRSYTTLMEMVDHAASLLDKLELPYRILRLCGGDLGFTSALTFDFEVFSAAQKKWLEVSSVSNFLTFQSNRMNLRYRENGSRKTKLAHTLNGSALALARIMAALLENNQYEGGIRIPEVLHPYTGFKEIS